MPEGYRHAYHIPPRFSRHSCAAAGVRRAAAVALAGGLGDDAELLRLTAEFQRLEDKDRDRGKREASRAMTRYD